MFRAPHHDAFIRKGIFAALDSAVLLEKTAEFTATGAD